jgi:hypothetical protein
MVLAGAVFFGAALAEMVLAGAVFFGAALAEMVLAVVALDLLIGSKLLKN